MFGQQHVNKQLSPYAHGELPAAESARVSAHLAACERCRTEFEEITYGIRLAESLKTQAAPATLWDNIEAALAEEAFKQNQAQRAQPEGARGKDSRVGWLSGRRFGSFSGGFGGWRPALAASFVLLLMLGAGGVWFYLRQTRTSWEVARLSGAPSIDADRIGSTGRLGVGEWLETDANSRAQIKVA
ncbi:MAG TPA: zf-HC2 domain-containing protein, partial [Pyrinomonadaceae bacterium]|nr:zf-HC2 domain-containing protein [Pyrinomonadaceae bacterium]